METNISNDCLSVALEGAPLIGEAFNWMGLQVRWRHAVNSLVKCPHPGVGFESYRLLIIHFDVYRVFASFSFNLQYVGSGLGFGLAHLVAC